MNYLEIIKPVRKYTPHVLLAAVLACAVVLPARGGQRDPVEVLKSDASYRQKEEACRTLSRRGGPEAVPVLASLLTDKKLSHMARYALERIPGTEADRALREKLDESTGDIRAGIIKSLEVRGDTRAIPRFMDLLGAEDPVVSAAAARALGRFGTSEAARALEEAVGRSDLSDKEMHAFADGLLSCAESLAEEDETDRAAVLYEKLLEHPEAPQPVRTAALRGVALARRGAKGLDPVLQALHADNERMFGAALRAARELDGGDRVSKALAGELSDLSEVRQVRLLQALGQRGDSAAGATIMGFAREGATPVRVAALEALTRIGYEDALDMMQSLAWKAKGKVARAARDGLAYFPTPAGDKALKDMLSHDSAEPRRVAVKLIAEGGLANPAEELMTVADSSRDKEARLAALKALRKRAGIPQFGRLVDVLLEVPTDEERKAAETAIRSILSEARKLSSENITIKEAVYGVLPDGKSADVTGKVAEMVKEGSLEIKASNDNFGDPAPGSPKKLRVTYAISGASTTRTVEESETLALTGGTVPTRVVKRLQSVLNEIEGQDKIAIVRLLKAAGGPEALKSVQGVISRADGKVKNAALRALCDWPTPEALPAIMDLAENPPNDTIGALAVRGAVRLLRKGFLKSDRKLKHYKTLLEHAESAGQKRTILSGLATVRNRRALDLALREVDDTDLRAEALQAAISIAGELGGDAKVVQNPFEDSSLADWAGNNKYWRSEDGSIVGSSDKAIPKTQYLWAPGTMEDFHLVARVKLEPNTGNSGIQFRSTHGDGAGAAGLQADIGKGVWGRLYDQGGRGKLDWTGTAEEAVKPGEWNRYEILAVGPAIWTAINGRLGARCLDEKSRRSGALGFQLHQGEPMTVRIRVEKIVHNPPVKLAGRGAEELIKALEIPSK